MEETIFVMASRPERLLAGQVMKKWMRTVQVMTTKNNEKASLPQHWIHQGGHLTMGHVGGTVAGDQNTRGGGLEWS